MAIEVAEAVSVRSEQVSNKVVFRNAVHYRQQPVRWKAWLLIGHACLSSALPHPPDPHMTMMISMTLVEHHENCHTFTPSYLAFRSHRLNNPFDHHRTMGELSDGFELGMWENRYTKVDEVGTSTMYIALPIHDDWSKLLQIFTIYTHWCAGYLARGRLDGLCTFRSSSKAKT